MKTVEEISKLLTIARAAGLDVSACDKLTPEEIAKLYNGIGPESWPEILREVTDEHLHLFEAGAMIHDVDYALGIWTKEDFTAANDRLGRNCVKLAKAKYGLFSHPLKRWEACVAGRLIGKACEKFGWKAYEAAIKAAKEAK